MSAWEAVERRKETLNKKTLVAAVSIAIGVFTVASAVAKFSDMFDFFIERSKPVREQAITNARQDELNKSTAKQFEEIKKDTAQILREVRKL